MLNKKESEEGRDCFGSRFKGMEPIIEEKTWLHRQGHWSHCFRSQETETSIGVHAADMQGGSSHSGGLSLENPSRVCSETCVLGDSERCQVGAINVKYQRSKW